MKKSGTKIMALFLALVLLAGSAPLGGEGIALLADWTKGLGAVTANAAADDTLCDVDGSGDISAADARLALRAAVGLENYAKGSKQFLAADADKSGDITAADARLILRAAVGLETLGNPQTQDYVYKPDEESISYDEKENMIFFNDLINVYLFFEMDDAQAERLANSVDGTVVGVIKGSINFLQIKIKGSSLSEIEKKCDLLMRNDNVLYATYDTPQMIEESAFDSDPWNADASAPIADKNEEEPDGNDWWAEAIGAYSAWKKTDGNTEKIKIGIIDSGFYDDHPDLSGQISFLPSYTENTEGNHGTHVAGLIGAKNNSIGMRGVCVNSDLYCVDWSPITNDENDDNFIDYTTTGEYLKITKQLIEKGVKVINNSWAIDYVFSENKFTKDVYGEMDNFFKFLHQKYEKYAIEKTGAYDSYMCYVNARAKNTGLQCILMMIELFMNGKEDFLIVQASGNGYDNRGPGMDAFLTGCFCAINRDLYEVFDEETRDRLKECFKIDYDRIASHKIIVGATSNTRDADGNYKMTTFSNFGETVDICAPGDHIYSTVFAKETEQYTYTTEQYTYNFMSGTSMAAPIVAGSAALVWSYYPSLTAAEVKDRLLKSIQCSAVGVGDGNEFKYPMLNVDTAIAGYFGNVVFDLGNTYYWKYNSNSYLKDDFTFGNYWYNKNTTNRLICRKPDGSETTVVSTNGAGAICIADDRLFYQVVTGDYSGANYTIKSCRLDGTDVKTIGDGVLRGVVDKGKYVIIENTDYNNHEIYSVATATGAKTTLSKDMFICCCNKYVLYYTSNSASNLKLGELNVYRVGMDGNNVTKLFTNKAKDLESISSSYGSVSGYLQIATPFVSGNTVYYCFEHIAGSGAVIQSNQIVKIDLTTDEAKTIEGGIAWTEDYNSYVIPEGEAYADYLNNLNKNTVLKKEDYAGFSSLDINSYEDVNNGKLKIEYCESIGSKTYVLLSYGTFSRWNGWRDLYRFSKCALFEKNNETGAVTMIYSTN